MPTSDALHADEHPSSRPVAHPDNPSIERDTKTRAAIQPAIGLSVIDAMPLRRQLHLAALTPRQVGHNAEPKVEVVGDAHHVCTSK